MLMATQSPATVVAVTAIMLTCDVFVVSLRFLARRQRRQPLQADDWLCFASLILSFGLSITLFIGVAQRALAYSTPTSTALLPRTALEMSNDKIIIVSRIQYIFLVISVPTLGFIKASVLFFYRRIFVVDKTNLRNVQNLLYISMLTIVGIWAMGFMFSFMFACKGNFVAWWTSAISLIENCVNTLELFFAFAVSDFIFDCVIIITPIPMIWNLHLPTAKKLGVLLIFLLGILATVASLIRMIWVIWARAVGFDVSLDQNLLITTSLFWNMLEISISIVASCLPVLRGLVRKQTMDSWVHSIRDMLSLHGEQLSDESVDSAKLSSSKSEVPSNELHVVTVTVERVREY
ncbi:hypothetical protein FB567DRAFT_521873 [Paraphoma chrysanthemicola]|uniref:Rhodopsin domain-containing protein n=1 Tax=Paraphoma chrysanthemicola TaxID=798071 RepID=A0A8K0RA02_9PLEO|nr:hypothetical protein FB567DRAFT_521873 [Paraphoma chrysanthemicola]